MLAHPLAPAHGATSRIPGEQEANLPLLTTLPQAYATLHAEPTRLAQTLLRQAGRRKDRGRRSFGLGKREVWLSAHLVLFTAALGSLATACGPSPKPNGSLHE